MLLDLIKRVWTFFTKVYNEVGVQTEGFEVLAEAIAKTEPATLEIYPTYSG